MAAPVPMAVSREVWEVAEQASELILNKIRPTIADDQYRRDVTSFVSGLLKSHFQCEVFPYGSVPLRTYLPDGDIDLTVIFTSYDEHRLSSDVFALLMEKEQDKSTTFKIKDVRLVNAEVNIVKCLVENVVVDISFNQLGGLSALCFLEKVDEVIANYHFFKQATIMIKSWCFYESRILGAHHGLLSTYALETLVLHIFHLFHSSLYGPLSVLYRFLVYFGQFEWDNYCVSLSGAVRRDSLPAIVVKEPENGSHSPLLSENFLQDCIEKFFVPSKDRKKPFLEKDINIIDVLKANNNLGRSVNQSNFQRIRSALRYGACKLGKILLLPKERIANELNSFFVNTLERCKTSAFHIEHFDFCHANSMLFTSTSGHQDARRAGSGNIERRQSLKMDFSEDGPEMMSGKYLNPSDAKKSSLSKGSSGYRASFSSQGNCKAPQGNEIRHACKRMPAKPAANDYVGFTRPESHEKRPESNEKSSVARTMVVTYGARENIVPNRLVCSGPSSSGNSVSYKSSLLNLRGHYDSYLRNFMYGKQHRFAALSMPVPLLYQLPSMATWEYIQQCSKLDARAHAGRKAFDNSGSECSNVNSPIFANASIRLEEQKSRHRASRHNRSRRNRMSHRERFVMPEKEPDKSSLEVKTHEFSPEDFPVLGNGKSISPDLHQRLPSVWHSSNVKTIEKFRFGNVPLVDENTSLSEPAAKPEDPEATIRNTPPETNEKRDPENLFHLTYEVEFPPLSR